MKRFDLTFAGLFLAIVVALLVVDCSKSPAKVASQPPDATVAASQLIGNWKVTVEAPGGVESPPTARETTPDSDEALRRALRALESKGEIAVRITYRADGTGVIESSAAGKERKKLFSWGLMTTSPDQIRVEQETSNPPRLERITYKIDSPDQMTIMNGSMQGSRLQRVK